jgi:hypothetical protein
MLLFRIFMFRLHHTNSLTDSIITYVRKYILMFEDIFVYTYDDVIDVRLDIRLHHAA